MSFQDLASELLICILGAAPSRAELRATISTSKRLYSIFQDNKTVLIYQALSNELGPVLGDALALSNLQPLNAESSSYYQQVQDYLIVYEKFLTCQNHPNTRQLSLEYVLGLIDYQRVMAYITNVYITSKLMFFRDDLEPCSKDMPLDIPPSREEHLRILRAFYRLQISLHVHGISLSGWRRKHNQKDVKYLNYRLFNLWEPWELEQVLCAAYFIESLHDQFTQIPYQVIGGAILRNEGLSWRSIYRLRVLRDFVEKLRLVDESEWQKALQQISTLTPKRKEFRDWGTFGNYRMNAFSFRTQHHDYRMRKFPLGKYSIPTEVSFNGETITSAPFAWVDAFNGQYEQDYFAGKTKTRLAKIEMKQLGGRSALWMWELLGFVMWDAPRVTALKMSPNLSEFATGWAR